MHKCFQTVKPSHLLENKKKKVHITPVQQMLNRFDALQKAASSSCTTAVKQSSSEDSVAMKQRPGPAEGKLNSSTTVCDNTKVPCATKPKLGVRVAHKPTLVKIVNRFFTLLVILILSV